MIQEWSKRSLPLAAQNAGLNLPKVSISTIGHPPVKYSAWLVAMLLTGNFFLHLQTKMFTMDVEIHMQINKPACQMPQQDPRAGAKSMTKSRIKVMQEFEDYTFQVSQEEGFPVMSTITSEDQKAASEDGISLQDLIDMELKSYRNWQCDCWFFKSAVPEGKNPPHNGIFLFIKISRCKPWLFFFFWPGICKLQCNPYYLAILLFRQFFSRLVTTFSTYAGNFQTDLFFLQTWSVFTFILCREQLIQQVTFLRSLNLTLSQMQIDPISLIF